MLRMLFALQLLMILGRLTLCAKYHELCIITIIVYNIYNLRLLCTLPFLPHYLLCLRFTPPVLP
jgi:hypothetical protein